MHYWYMKPLYTRIWGTDSSSPYTFPGQIPPWTISPQFRVGHIPLDNVSPTIIMSITAYMYICVCILRSCVYVCIHVYVYIHVYVCMYTWRVCMYTCVCLYVCMYACMYLCMYTLQFWWLSCLTNQGGKLS